MVVRRRSTGLLGNLMNSVMMVPVGIFLFLCSFPVIYMVANRTNWAEIAKTSTAANAEGGGHDGAFISVSGSLTSSEQIGDPMFVTPGPFITLSRDVEVYSWIEQTRSTTRDKVGGGTETITEYYYEQGWRDTPPDTSRFEVPGYTQATKRFEDETFRVSTASVGGWSFSVSDVASGGMFNRGMPGGEALNPTQLSRTGEAASGNVEGNYVYLDGSTSASPWTGAHRLQFRGLRSGAEVTAFGAGSGSQLVAAEVEDDSFFRIVSGNRETALSSLQAEYAAAGMAGYFFSFILMWGGMNLVFSPLHAVMGILPFLKRGSKALVSMVTFPVALVLTGVTIVISKISVFLAFIVVAGAFGFGVFTLYKRAKANQAQAPAAA